MTGCSAPHCNAHTDYGHKFHRFPTDPERRKKWLINCKRGNWTPKPSDRLCSKHFENSQYEQHRQDGKRQLKPFAVPTLFDVPNLPKKVFKSEEVLYRELIPLNVNVPNNNNFNENISVTTVNDCKRCVQYEIEIQELKDTIKTLREEVANEKVKPELLNDEQQGTNNSLLLIFS